MSDQDSPRMIFRADAVRRYLQGQEASVLPRWVAPRVFRFLWVVVALLAVGAALAWVAEVPVYASGAAVIVEGSAAFPAEVDGPVVLAFMSPADLDRLRAGQKLFLNTGDPRNRWVRPVVAIEPEVFSPAAIQERFDLHAAAAQAVSQPATVAIARLEPVPDGMSGEEFLGSVFQADIEVGSRRVISFLSRANRKAGG